MADVKLFRPERLTDNPDGGGLATATEIVDGQVNNLFDDISRIDRVNGELSLRKAFALAATADTALYSDLHLIVQAPPQDPRVSAVLFRTKKAGNFVWDDERDDAKAQVERYLDESVISRMIPYDRQLEGQRTVLVYQRKELSLPEIGEVFALKVDSTGAVEFIKVQDVDHEVQTFTDEGGDFQVRVVTLTISQPLSQEFSGSQPNRYFTVDAGKSVVRKTIASDAARYKGVVSLAQDASIGDLTVKLESIFAQLVPAATTEVAVTDAEPAGATAQVIINESVITALSMTVAQDGSGNLYLPIDAQVGSIVIEVAGGGVARWVEQPTGGFVRTGGSGSTGTVWTALTRSHLSYAGLNNSAGQLLTVKIIPALQVSKSAQSYQIPVQTQNRGYVYVASLQPLPTPGSTIVSFRSQGRWYTLEDDGSGALVGEVGVGVGQVNFQTGTVQVTLGALPDVGSSIIFAFGGQSEYEIRTGAVDIQPPEIRRTVVDGNVEPGTFSVSWLAGGVTKTATDDGAGTLSGGGTGRIIYSTGEYVLRPTLLPDPATEYVATYEAGATIQDTFTPSISSGSIALQASVVPLRPKSVVIDYTGTSTTILHTFTRSRRLTDNGSGQLLDEAGVIVAGSDIDYGTGLCSFNPNFNSYVPEEVRESFSNVLPGRVVSTSTGYYSPVPIIGQWIVALENQSKTVPFTNGTTVTMRYKQDSTTDASQTDTAPAQPLRIDFLPAVGSSIVPGGLLFTMGGRTYYEHNSVLFYGMSPGTGVGTPAGSVDYVAGTATLTSWAGGVAPALSLKGLLTILAQLPLGVVHGRTPGSPLRPGTFFLQANRYRDGALISGSADNNGNIDTAGMHGYVDVNTGVFSVAFGAYVLDSSLSSGDKAEPWYDVANVDVDGYIWRPAEIQPGSVRFNCVVQTSLPQDPDIIKVNPVRLPSDGRVPVIRAGDTLVLHDTQPETLPTGLVADQVIALPRTGLASVAVYDANGLGVDPALFNADLVAGEITMANPLDLGAYEEPLVALHTIEDMALCLDAQITGEVALGQALTHGYTADNSLCSSALIVGDAQARYEHLFAQATWTNVWSNDVIGSPPSSGAQYNDATYPVVVLNRDAISQRWRLAFTSSTAFTIVGEEIGVIGTGTTSGNVAPINPATGQPYFTLSAAGFGSGWGTGNTIRFNTVAAGAPVWCARTVRSGPATNLDDLIRLQMRWDKD